ncbi:MAG: hypothetical protein ACTSR3_22300 [Candidatus Helarchaeota archaeon]
MSYQSENQMYPYVENWLQKILNSKYRRHNIITAVTSHTKLCNWLEHMGLHRFFPDYLTYDIKIDVLGIAHTDTRAHLAFVECKLKSISLKDIAQLLGYSKVAQPKLSIIVSPSYISRPISELLVRYSRLDVLAYNEREKIKIAKWDCTRSTIYIESLIPQGEHI